MIKCIYKGAEAFRVSEVPPYREPRTVKSGRYGLR